MNNQQTPQPNLETPSEGQPQETQATENTPTFFAPAIPTTSEDHLAEIQPETTPAVAQTDEVPKSEFTTGFTSETAEPVSPESEMEPQQVDPLAEEPTIQPAHEETVPVEPSRPEPFMPADTPLDDEPEGPEEVAEAPEPPEPFNKSFFIAAAVRIATVSLISIFFMRLFGGAGSTCSTTALPLNYACSLNYLWLTVVGVCGFAILELVISKVSHRKYSHAMPVAGFVLGTYTFYQVSQTFAALSGSEQKLPTITVLHFMPALITALVAAIGIALAHYIRVKKVRKLTAVAFPIAALMAIIILPIVLTEHFTTVTLASQVKAEKTIKTNLKNTAIAAAAAGVNLYIPKNYTGPLQIKYVKPFFKVGDYPRYVLTFQLPSGKNLEMSAHKKDATNNPPTSCGDFLPYTIKPSTKLASLAFPCKLVLTTDSGRKVYGFYDSSITDTIKLDSVEISKYQPSAFYIYIDNTVISFLDTTAVSGQASTITPEVMHTFVDSLQLFKDKELQDFIDKYGV